MTISEVCLLTLTFKIGYRANWRACC